MGFSEARGGLAKGADDQNPTGDGGFTFGGMDTAASAARVGRRRVPCGPGARFGAWRPTTGAARRIMVAPCLCLRVARGGGHWWRPHVRDERAHHRRSWPPLRSLPFGVGGSGAAALWEQNQDKTGIALAGTGSP